MSESTQYTAQQHRNRSLLEASRYMRTKVTSKVLPLRLDPAKQSGIDAEQVATLEALGIDASRTAIKTLASLAKIDELDHLGGGLDLIPALMLSMVCSDYEKVTYTIENAHASIAYYSNLATLGYLEPQVVIDGFRRGIDIPGHVSWVPGGTQLNGGRLGVMVPVATGQALGMKARLGKDAWVICHCGDAGWISGQALNGFNGADLHGAPLTMVMHRNGIQLSSSNKNIMDKDPRPIIASLGIEILEIASLHNTAELYGAYRHARQLASNGRPSLIYPKGFRSEGSTKVTLKSFGEKYGILGDVEKLAKANNVAMTTDIWIPGALMSFRDVVSMIECVFLVNDLPGGKDHHDGHMKGRDEAAVLSHSMLTMSEAQKKALDKLRASAKLDVITEARPAPGSPNLVISANVRKAVSLPGAGKSVSCRVGSEAAYDLVAKTFPQDVFIVSCDLDPSTKLGKARKHLAADHQFEMSIEEQVATLMADGLAMSSRKPQLNVVSTFAAFYEGIAREGLEMWRYQRNLNGVNEGLNVVMHLSHVGANTGRDHFSGWSLDFITLSLGYLPYVDRIYTPSDARSAFIAVMDAASRYGAHIVNIPRDNLPILTKADGSEVFAADSAWEPVTAIRKTSGAKKAILGLGATAYLAVEAASQAGEAVDAYVINGFPFGDGELSALLAKYPGGVVTIEDGIIGTRATGLRGFAGMVISAATLFKVPTSHVGISDPRIAPAEGHQEIWEHFGLTKQALLDGLKSL